MDKKSKSIIDHCKFTYARCNMYDKAILHKKCNNIYKKSSLCYDGNIYDVSICMHNEFQRARVFFRYGLYYRSPIDDDMYEKCLDEQHRTRGYIECF